MTVKDAYSNMMGYINNTVEKVKNTINDVVQDLKDGWYNRECAMRDNDYALSLPAFDENKFERQPIPVLVDSVPTRELKPPAYVNNDAIVGTPINQYSGLEAIAA